MSIKNILRGGLLVTAATVAIAANANASVQAWSNMQLSNLKVTLAPADTNVSAIISATQANATTSVNGSSSVNTVDTPTGALFSVYDPAASTQGAAAAHVTAAELAGTGNVTYTRDTATPGSSFAYSDSYLDSIKMTSPSYNSVTKTVSGLLDLTTSGVTKTSAQGALTDSTDAYSADSHITENTDFVLTAPAGSATTQINKVTLSFDYDIEVGAVVTAGDIGKGHAFGDFVIALLDENGTKIANFNFAQSLSGTDFNFTSSNLLTQNPAGAPQVGTGHLTGTFSIDVDFFGTNTPLTLDLGKQYTIQFDQHSDITLSRIATPEPISVGLFGMGLVGLGALRRRKA